MVLTFNRAWLMEVRREKLPRALTWLLLASVVAFFTWSIVSRRYTSCYRKTVNGACAADVKPGTAALPIAP
jgi:hypothetical protein